MLCYSMDVYDKLLCPLDESFDNLINLIIFEGRDGVVGRGSDVNIFPLCPPPTEPCRGEDVDIFPGVPTLSQSFGVFERFL